MTTAFAIVFPIKIAVVFAITFAPAATTVLLTTEVPILRSTAVKLAILRFVAT